jgi:LytS/YehU family sensor histidine kinase
MLAIKYYKDWFKKQSEGEMLMRENKLAELQLLKAQIHPHFLFNTLNNIYSFTLTGSPKAEGLVNKLSGMINYITTEGEKSFVPVEKEIQLIKDYIGLEKVRYGDRLHMQIEIQGAYNDKMIAPLLMIPFVENCFKHGASVMRGRQWIRLSIHIKEGQLDFNLSNSKPPQAIGANNKKGIGLANVQKRLQLLYPGRHFLKIESTGDTYNVYLQVSLQPLSASVHTNKLIPIV